MNVIPFLRCTCRSEFQCLKSKLCIPRWFVMNNKKDCNTALVQDSSDETNRLSSCKTTEFTCHGKYPLDNSTLRCIPREWVADGDEDCADGMDEKVKFNQCIDDIEFHCAIDGRCIPRYRVLDGVDDCSDGSDEIKAIHCIPHKEFRCVADGRCIPRSWRGNNMINCVNGSDELPMPLNETCVDGEFRCKNNKRCIPTYLLCDGMDHCGDCSDEIEICMEPKMFRCPNDPTGKCIHRSFSCDSFMDCPNHGDDVTSVPGFKCHITASVGQKPKHCVVPQWSLFDDYSACDDKSDLCASNSSKCTRCIFSNLTISEKQVCDGIIDCPDLSDECPCSSLLPLSNRSRQLCDRICYGTSSIACEKCERGEMFCDEKCLGISKVCDGFADCPKSQLDEAFCSPSSNETKSSEIVVDFLCDKIRDDVKVALAKFLPQTTINDLLPTKAARYDFQILFSQPQVFLEIQNCLDKMHCV